VIALFLRTISLFEFLLTDLLGVYCVESVAVENAKIISVYGKMTTTEVTLNCTRGRVGSRLNVLGFEL